MSRYVHRLVYIPALLILGLTGCVGARQWTSTGGDRETGLVRVSYQYPEFHQPNVSDVQARELAENRCAAWGYARAEPVAGLVRECSNTEAGNCNLWTVTREFQCGGDASYAARLSK